MTPTALREDRGQVTAFVVIITLALILLFALVAEGGAALSTRSRALSLAQEAARAGAQQLDLAAYRAGQTATLNAPAAEQAAQSFLHRSGADGQARVTARPSPSPPASTTPSRCCPWAPAPWPPPPPPARTRPPDP